MRVSCSGKLEEGHETLARSICMRFLAADKRLKRVVTSSDSVGPDCDGHPNPDEG